MKFKTLNGREINVDLRPSKYPRRDENSCKSKIQYSVGLIVDELFPNEVVLEEFYVPEESLYIDFYLPRKKLAVEVMGEQHYTYNAFFHGSKENFRKARQRDSNKARWCQINGINLISIPYASKPEETKKQIGGT